VTGGTAVPSASTASAPLAAQKSPAYASFGRARLADFCEDWVVYRNLEPLDKRLHGLKTAYMDMELRTEMIPRKQDAAYAKAATYFLNEIQRLRGVKTPLGETLFLGDTQFNDSQAFKNIRQFSRWQGSCFICTERVEQDPSLTVDNENVFTANRWGLLAEWVRQLREQGLQLDGRTSVIVDIDKTALGAKGRNDKTIDRARLAGIFRTMDSVLGDDFKQAIFERDYAELNRARYHPVTADNQDYLAYICMVLNTNLISLDEVKREVETDSLDNFEQFIRWVDSRMMINPAAGEALREVHEAVNASVRNGDPTPFKRFRRQEFISTMENMGQMPDTATVTELLQEEITLTEEVFDLANWLRERGCIILCLSDKPDEASMPHPRVSPDLVPLHKAETHRVGVSITAELNTIG
jgi:hypothetical protein